MPDRSSNFEFANVVGSSLLKQHRTSHIGGPHCWLVHYCVSQLWEIVLLKIGATNSIVLCCPLVCVFKFFPSGYGFCVPDGKYGLPNDVLGIDSWRYEFACQCDVKVGPGGLFHLCADGTIALLCAVVQSTESADDTCLLLRFDHGGLL